MITLKHPVLIAAKPENGWYFGGGSLEIWNCFMKIGLAFQVQDDYLDAFGNTEKFSKSKLVVI